MIKTILAPLDGSPRAEAILPYVEDLALRYSAKVLLLHVVELVPLILGPEGALLPFDTQAVEPVIRDAETYLTRTSAALRDKGITTEVFVVCGAVVQTILDVAEREGAGLIAMASHGRTGLARVFYGSVAAGVLHRVDRPLLLIRAERDS
jgi:nucleotide-binding universal stress UspA family protein